MQKTKILCFDLDDTLMDDNYKFELTFCDCIRTIITALETRSPQIDDVLQTARNIDNEKWITWDKKDRYMPRRVASAWVEAYEKLAIQQNIPVKPHIKRLLWAQVMTNYDPPYFVIPGAIETLIKLNERGYKKIIITAGHNRIQNRKLKLTRMSRFFDEIYVTYDKSLILKDLADKYRKENLVMIGNSLRSDINPALELGIEAVYIPRGAWHQFKAEPVNNNYKKMEKIEDLLNLF